MTSGPEPRKRWWPVTVGLVAAAIVGTVAAAMWQIEPMANDDPQARVAAAQTAFTIGFGVGGLATLGLFARRQWLQERVHAHERYDAKERRITDQYLAAVEQLGHAKAPVRLAGLYVLDRLGRDHSEQRQVIAEVWCAYLRRRYTPPPELLDRSADRTGSDWTSSHASSSMGEENPYDEYEVRMTAQRLLATHLHDGDVSSERDRHQQSEPREFWRLNHLDLTGATLIDADFAHCRLPRFKAAHARFHGNTSFESTRFGGEAGFQSARFEGSSGFGEARFESDAWFRDARFEGVALFEKARFDGNAGFRDSHFQRDASFRETHFTSVAWFPTVHFGGDVGYQEAHFGGVALFEKVHFAGHAWFKGTHFAGNAGFLEARFDDATGFKEAHFVGTADFERVRFVSAVGFEGARFENVARFKQGHFEGSAMFEAAHFLGPVRFEGSQVDPQSRFVMTNAIVHRRRSDEDGHGWPSGWKLSASGDHWTLVQADASVIADDPSAIKPLWPRTASIDSSEKLASVAQCSRSTRRCCRDSTNSNRTSLPAANAPSTRTGAARSKAST